MNNFFGCTMATFVIGTFAFAGWLTHVIHCLGHNQWGFLIAGALMFPIGVLHGWGLWFGFF